MQGFLSARERLRARPPRPAPPPSLQLAQGLLESGKAHFLPFLSSALARDILTRGYDARTLERVYGNRPAGELGPVGRLADRVVLDLPVHSALRERLQAAVGEICAAAVLAVRAGAAEYRILSTPSGLGCELEGAARRLRSSHPDVLARLRCWGLDRDPEILTEARRRLRDAGLAATLLHGDLRTSRELQQAVEREGPFHLVSCVGLPASVPPDQRRDTVSRCARLLAPGGTLLIDRWESSEPSRVAATLGVRMPPCSAREMQSILADCGLAVEREHPSGEGGCVLVVARKPLPG